MRRDHEENKKAFACRRHLNAGSPSSNTHPAGLRLHRRPEQGRRREIGLGFCNITKDADTDACPKHINIMDSSVIPIPKRAVDRKEDPVVWLGDKHFRGR